MARETDTRVGMRVHLALPPVHLVAPPLLPPSSQAIKGPLDSAPRLIANWPLNIIAARKSEAADHFRFPFSPFPFARLIINYFYISPPLTFAQLYDGKMTNCLFKWV